MNNWEEALLGTILNDPSTLVECEGLLPSDFTFANRVAFSEIAALALQNAVGPRSLTEALKNSAGFKHFADVGKPEDFVATLMYYRGAEPAYYVKQILDASIRKALKLNAALIAAEADGNSKTAEELMEYAEGRILSLRRNKNEGAATLEDIVSVFMPRLAAVRNGTFKPAFVPDILGLRDILCYLESTDSVCIAARPGVGKSSLLKYEFGMAATPLPDREQKRVGILNFENDPMDYARGYLGMFTGINTRKIKTGKLTDMEVEAIKAAASIMKSLPIFIHTMSSPSAGQVRQRIRRLVHENHIDMVGIDYLQLMNNGKENKNEDVSTSSQQLRASAIELGIPHINAAQLNRAIETRGGDQEPKLSDLRDSGSIEQDHTVIVFITPTWTNPTQADIAKFPDNFDQDTRQWMTRPRVVPVKMHVAKNRNGEIGVTEPIAFDKGTGRFRTLVTEPA